LTLAYKNQNDPHFLALVDESWTIFLDRDGVINRKRENDYVKSLDEMEILPGVLEAIYEFSGIFRYIVIVTNQQGIGKGLMTEVDLLRVHAYLVYEIENAGGKINGIYHCPHLSAIECECRKPNSGMAYMAQRDLPHIDFKKSIMVGDSASDMEFGERLGMYNILVSNKKHISNNCNIFVKNLKNLSSLLKSYRK
jgi:histidinol-phosphate phosphatase family protein